MTKIRLWRFVAVIVPGMALAMLLSYIGSWLMDGPWWWGFAAIGIGIATGRAVLRIFGHWIMPDNANQWHDERG